MVTEKKKFCSRLEQTRKLITFARCAPTWAKDREQNTQRKGSVVRLAQVLLFMSSLFINLFNKSWVDDRWETSNCCTWYKTHRIIEKKWIERRKKERASVIFELIRYLLLSRRRIIGIQMIQPNANGSTMINYLLKLDPTANPPKLDRFR